MREIEIKAKVTDKAALLRRLDEQNIKLGTPKTHHDLVFCKPGQQDYETGSVWLRVRTENGTKAIFTLKIDTGRKLDSIEHEVEVSDAAELETMLKLMGLALYSDLTKTRQKAKVGDIEICLDDVDGLGIYLEAEILAPDDANSEATRTQLWNFMEKLGYDKGNEETLGYDVLLKRKDLSS